jgi:uncharacterized membrane protein YhiD involved in acid resistance
MKINLPKLPKLMFMGIDIIKNFLFFTFFIILSLFFLATMAAPAIKFFKSKKYENVKLEKIYLNKEREYNKLLKEHNTIRHSEAKILMSFNREFNKNDFINFANKYIKIENIENIDIKTYNKNFTKKRYIIKSTIDSPKNIYEMIKELDKYKNIIQIKLPISMENKKDKIEAYFILEHFKIK